MSWDQPVNQGGNSWNVIAGTQPAADLASRACNAVPGVNLAPQDLTGTAATGTHGWWIHREMWVYNHQVPLVDVQIEVKWTYGIGYKGVGTFITGCWVEVPRCEVGWGFDVKVDFVVDDVENAGTQKAPIARLKGRLLGTITTPKFTQELDHSTVIALGDGSRRW